MRNLQKILVNIFAKREAFNPDKMLQEYEEGIARQKAGWRFWPANATEAQKRAAMELYVETGECRWYSPGEIGLPFVVDGTIIKGE